MSTTTVEHTIWRGPLLGSQRQELLKEVTAYLQQELRSDVPAGGHSVIYLVASRPLLSAISLEILAGQTVKGILDGLPVYLFNGLLRRLLRTARVKHEGTGWQKVAYRRDISGEDYPLRRPLIAQLMRQLTQRRQLPAFGQLATARGCVASVTRLIGEITRAGKTAAEFTSIVEERIARLQESLPPPPSPQSAEQIYGYERDVAQIMQCYATALNGGIPENSLHQSHTDQSPAATEKFTESDADYLRAMAALDGSLDGLPCQTPLLDGVEWLIVDGFFDLTPVQGEILRRLIKRIPRVTFNFDDDADNPAVFAAVHETIAKIREMMGEGCREVIFHERTGSRPVTRLPTAPGLDVLRMGLFNPAFTPPPDTTAPVFLAAAPDIERELRHIAKTIKRYVREERRSPADIAIVLRDRDTYGAHLRRVLSDEGIAYALDERLPVTDIPAVRAWLKLVAAAADRPRGETTSDRIPVSRLVDILKSDYFTLPGHQMSADDIENVVAFVGEQLHLADWLKRAEHLAKALPPTEANSHSPAADEAETGEGSDVDSGEPMVRPDAVTAAQLQETGRSLRELGQILAKIPIEGTAGELNVAIEQALSQLSYEKELEADIQKAIGQPQQRLQATLDLRGLQAVRRAAIAVADAERLATRSLAATLGEPSTTDGSQPTRMPLAVFLSDILQALDDLTLRVEPETFGAVHILEVTTIRGLHFPIIFVPGLVEGGFPPRLPGDWLYPPAERERLKADGLVLEDISPATMVKEEHYFYQVVCRATAAVHLSYPTVGAEDQELVPSSFLAEIQRLVPATAPGGPHHILVAKGYDGATFLEATTCHELLRQTAAAEARRRRGQTIAQPASESASAAQMEGNGRSVLSLTEQLEAVQEYVRQQGWLSDNLRQRQKVEADRYSHLWTPFDGQIEEQGLQAELNERFGEQHVFSATAFNEYAACPFRFFAHRVLQLHPRVSTALDLQASERGRLLHDILRDFYRATPLLHNGATLEDELERLKKTADEVFRRYEENIPPLNTKIWMIEKRILLNFLEQLITEEASYGKKAEHHITELAFGMAPPEADEHSVKKPLELTDSQGRKIQLRGQIDRVDVVQVNAEGNTYRATIIYDYKLSKGTSIAEMLKGRDVQIGIYLASIEKCFPSLKPVIGGGYYSITKTPRCSDGLYRSDGEELLPKEQKHSFLSEEEFRKTYESILDYVWKYKEQIEKGHFQVLPSRGLEECRFCDFKSVCRYETHRIQRKHRRA
ncbi:PD-(D/E)XK nuclease family protein [Chloracidobacterium thermophilum]|uniref:PD-(D/E)XK nuclease family protein n=1 Tax=Chloracidobacterium thermophilum TaxID=458033 RepID=UPI000738B03D|nr:PD-(D/E)XK nuclease family protein [Chloracidobacterium thermophilum]